MCSYILQDLFIYLFIVIIIYSNTPKMVQLCGQFSWAENIKDIYYYACQHHGILLSIRQYFLPVRLIPNALLIPNPLVVNL